MRKLRKKTAALLKDRKGNMMPLVVAVTICMLIIILGVAEYMRLVITAAGIKDAMESAVISTVNDNYNEVYHSVREGYAAGYEPDGESFSPSVDYGYIYSRMCFLLGLEEDGAGLVGGDGEGALLDHLPEGPLLQDHELLVLHLRELGVVRGGEVGDVEAGVPAAQMDGALAVRDEGDDVIRHLADDVPEEAGVQDQLGLARDVRVQVGPDAGGHVVAGDGEAVAGLQQQALQRGDGALGGHGAAGHGRGALQQGLFTGKFHHRSDRPFLEGCLFQKRKRKRFLAIDVVGGKLCGKRGKRAKVRGIERPQTLGKGCGRFARFFHEEKRGEGYQQS